MIEYIILVAVVLAFAFTTIIKKQYTNSVQGDDRPALFNLILGSIILIVYILMYIWNLDWNSGVLIYSLIWALSGAVCMFCSILALKSGPLSLTSLFMQLSLIVVTLFGIIFWGETFTITTCVGLVLVGLSLIFNLSPSRDDKKFNIKWLVLSILAMVANAGTAIAQRQQQINFKGEFGGMMLLFSQAFAVVVLLFIFLKSNKKGCVKVLRKTIKYSIMEAITNVVLNVGLVYLATKMSSNIVYPVLTVGSLFIVYSVSIAFYKEKLSAKKAIGAILAIIAIVLLNLK